MAPTPLDVPAAVADVPLGLYVHVPFCARRCGYCAFTTTAPGDGVSADDWATTHHRWVEGVVAEVATADALLGTGRPPLTSIYFGGGTPTAVAPELLVRILRAIRSRFETVEDLEVTVESNPDGLADGHLEVLAAAGVNRCSFGLQSAVPRVLELLDRTHPPERAAVAVAAARAAGIPHVGLDLIYGTPGETVDDWSASLELALGCGVDHLSAYALAVEPGTRLAARVRRGTLDRPDPDEAADRYEATDRACRAAGLEWYELSNWARTDAAQSRHNLLTWRDHHWWGVGPGAHSHVGGLRWWNHTDLRSWADLAATGHAPAAGAERGSESSRRTERIMLGIRLAEGLRTTPVTGGAPLETSAVDELIGDGLLERRHDRVVLTDRGRLLADHVARTLI